MISLNADFSKVGLAARGKPADLAFKVLGAKAKRNKVSYTIRGEEKIRTNRIL